MATKKDKKAFNMRVPASNAFQKDRKPVYEKKNFDKK